MGYIQYRDGIVGDKYDYGELTLGGAAVGDLVIAHAGNLRSGKINIPTTGNLEEIAQAPLHDDIYGGDARIWRVTAEGTVGVRTDDSNSCGSTVIRGVYLVRPVLMLGDVSLGQLAYYNAGDAHPGWTGYVSLEAGDWVMVQSHGTWGCGTVDPSGHGDEDGTAQFITHKKTVVHTTSAATCDNSQLYDVMSYAGLYEITAPGTFRVKGYRTVFIRARFPVYGGVSALAFLI